MIEPYNWAHSTMGLSEPLIYNTNSVMLKAAGSRASYSITIHILNQTGSKGRVRESEFRHSWLLHAGCGLLTTSHSRWNRTTSHIQGSEPGFSVRNEVWNEVIQEVKQSYVSKWSQPKQSHPGFSVLQNGAIIWHIKLSDQSLCISLIAVFDANLLNKILWENVFNESAKFGKVVKWKEKENKTTMVIG